jgi:hypothetical protein
MQHNGWDHALKVAADEAGLVGHAGAVPAPDPVAFAGPGSLRGGVPAGF